MQPIPATVANMATYARAGLVLLDPATGETFSATPGDYFMRDRDETMTNADGEPLVLAIRHAERAAPLYETPDALTVSERIRRRREARAAVTGDDNGLRVVQSDCRTGWLVVDSSGQAKSRVCRTRDEAEAERVAILAA